VEYSNYYRISKSLMLLKETEKDIGEIAGMTGFNNISYYNKIFKKYMHMTPSQFRQALQENETDACI
ncbi:MAG: helix-turn-helix domain-containing protein, partial [Eubacterium sp.]|nr:helix-turn-helix domain-containing protein [Eubacterium sp.]